MRQVAEWDEERRPSHGSGIRFLDFLLRDERIINFKAGKTTQMHRQKVCTSPAIASRWLTLTTTYTIDALARACTHMHVHTGAHKLQQRRSTRRYRYTCTYIHIYTYAILDRVYTYTRLITVSLHRGCRLAGIWAKQFREECKKKKKQKEESNFDWTCLKRSELSCCEDKETGVSSMLRRIEKVLEQVRQTTCGDVFRSTKGRCKDIFFPERYTVNKENGDCQYIYIYTS